MVPNKTSTTTSLRRQIFFIGFVENRNRPFSSKNMYILAVVLRLFYLKSELSNMDDYGSMSEEEMKKRLSRSSIYGEVEPETCLTVTSLS